MQKQKLTDDIWIYTFEPFEGKHFGFNMTLLLDGNKALLIDSGYELHGEAIQKDLEENGLTLEKMILTHYHPDHIYGMKALPKAASYGSSLYRETLDLYTPIEDHPYFIPDHLIDNVTTLAFGRHELTLIPHPGHSACQLLININNEFIIIADEIMLSNNGEHLCPSIDSRQNVKRHYDSLERLKAYTHLTMIPSHGLVLSDKREIEKDIQNRLLLFKAVLDSPSQITFEEAVKDCECTFLHPEWFNGFYK